MNEMVLIQRPWMVFVNLVLLFLLYYIYNPSSRGVSISKSRKRLGAFLILVFCLFSFWGTDWFHYYNLYNELKYDPYKATHLEDVYVWIINTLSFNYLSFRLIVWGTALMLLFDTLNNLSLDKDIALFLFVSISLIWFAYARVSLPMSLLFWGLSIIYKTNNSYLILHLFIGIAAIIVTYYFHKSSLFGIAIIFLAVLMNKLGRRFYILLLILFPFLVLLVRDYLADIMVLDLSREDSDFGFYVSSAQHYMDGDKTVRGIGAIIQRLLEIIPYYLMVVLSVKIKRHRSYNLFPSGIKIFVNCIFLIVVLSTVFLFIQDANVSVIYIRFLRYGFIPMIIVLAYCWKCQIFKKLTYIIWQVGFLGSIYAVSYTLYYSLV